jgi:hypothetical protein
MEFEVRDEGTAWTDAPRTLSPHEVQQMKEALQSPQQGHLAGGRIAAIRLHRQLTNSTLRAAIRCVDQIISDAKLPSSTSP